MSLNSTLHCFIYHFLLLKVRLLDWKWIEQKGFFITIFAIHSLFLLSSFFRRKKNTESRGQKSCLSARSENDKNSIFYRFQLKEPFSTIFWFPPELFQFLIQMVIGLSIIVWHYQIRLIQLLHITIIHKNCI